MILFFTQKRQLVKSVSLPKVQINLTITKWINHITTWQRQPAPALTINSGDYHHNHHLNE
ncbi:hypothetical protein DERP_013295 [Dermatophagoides pteronyssinus]|uniref:Uncharacterized protein n=1 Tax=Dermatophagoides pteronyssinus TaxID=6956 RepID=A0ABQ8J3I2_DERPT|nr:hypothetical protein DERP_013295 [Dermatophagoides pteronyssinus]